MTLGVSRSVCFSAQLRSVCGGRAYVLIGLPDGMCATHARPCSGGRPFSARPRMLRLHKGGSSGHRSRLAGYADRCSRSGTGELWHKARGRGWKRRQAFGFSCTGWQIIHARMARISTLPTDMMSLACPPLFETRNCSIALVSSNSGGKAGCLSWRKISSCKCFSIL